MTDVQLETAVDLGGTKLCLRPELRCSLRQHDGKPYYLLEDPIHSQFFHLGEREWSLVSLLDGTRTLREALIQAKANLGDDSLSQDEAIRLCRWLTNSRLATADTGSNETDRNWLPRSKPSSVINPLFLRIPLFNPDRLLSRILPWTRWILTVPAFLVWLVVCVWGASAVYTQWDRFCSSISTIFAPDNWLYLLLTWVFLKVLHEMFHGLICKKYGGTVPRCGIMLIMFSPIAYVDVTSSWRFASKWQRIFTAAAGIYIELFIAAVAALLWARGGRGIDAQLCHNIVTMAGLSTLLFNANFLMRFDGYYILSDLLEIRNLYTAGQEYLNYLGRRYVLNVPAVKPTATGGKMMIVRVYAVASCIWRIVFYVGVIVLASSLFHGAGIVLAVLSAVLWFGLPAFRFLKYLGSGTPGDRPNPLRFGAIATVTTGVLATVLYLPWPGGVSAPAVVEYSPLTIVRADSPGFVREVHVRDGQPVKPGQLLVVLENPKLEQQLAALEFAIQRSEVRARILHLENQIAESLVEKRNRGTLLEKRDELQRQVDGLTLRAAADGRVVGRNLHELEGQYFHMGSELMALGLEDRKELQLSIAQADVDSFRNEANRAVGVRMKGRGGSINEGELVRINPRATRVLLHPALAAPAGGPLTVRPRQSDDNTSLQSGEGLELPAPRFTAVVNLPGKESRRLKAGELARVRIRNTSETIGQHVFRLVKNFIDEKLGRGNV